MRILISGANRGLGLEFVRQYLARGEEVIATCRNPEKAAELEDLSVKYHDSLTILELDVTDPSARQAVYEEIRQRFKRIDMLINNAAIISGGSKERYRLGEMHKEDISKVLVVNAAAPLLLAEQFIDVLEKSDQPRIINITSRMGSISEKSGTSNYSYSASKCTLNMFSRMLSNDLRTKGFIVIAIHPGHVQTDMGGSLAPLKPEQSIRGMIRVIDSLSMTDSGKFLNWDGSEIPW